ncbi:MAG: 16S rRNA (uracil(1498)-N(3))-methyltransferase [Alphaproteobacteria bacterium]|nr:16S rRNA (uracil(1498)-N(3))-methyltransferase [Alphaproteobacteria bacterium]
MTSDSAARLYVTEDLSEGAEIALGAEQTHYLRNVLRLGADDRVSLFNGRDGEFAARIRRLGKQAAELSIAERRRPQATEPDLWLLFAPIKRQRVDFVAEKATELGISELQPVLTQYTVVERVNVARLQAHAIEAAEQSERLTVPVVREAVRLDRRLEVWPPDRRLIACIERRAAPPIAEALGALGRDGAQGPQAILVGPEGGFADAELDAFLKLPFVTPVSLGPRVLRADTAAIAALACRQAMIGDWR